MTKRNIITKARIKDVARFLKESIDWLVKEDGGCCKYELPDDTFAIFIGWSGGFDAADETIIKSPNGQENIGGRWTSCYAVEAAVKINNDFDWCDFEYLNYPWDPETGECWDNGVSMSPNMTDAEYEEEAKWFLENYVDMVNALNKGQIEID